MCRRNTGLNEINRLTAGLLGAVNVLMCPVKDSPVWEERNHSVCVFQSNLTIEPFSLERHLHGTGIQGNIYKPSLILAHSFYYEHTLFLVFFCSL